MIELSRTQDEEVGDGTTSVIVLCMYIISLMILLLKLLSNTRFTFKSVIGTAVMFYCLFDT